MPRRRTISTPETRERKAQQELIPYEKRVEALRAALVNPSDLRTDVELSKDVGLDLRTIKKLKSNPEFYNAVAEEFKRLLPSTMVDTIKSLMRQVERGSTPAAKLMLQASGLVTETGVTIVNNVGNGSSTDFIAKLTPMELDQEVNRLLREVFPSDIAFGPDGRTEEEAPFQVVDSDTSELAPGFDPPDDGTYYAGQAGELGETSDGEEETSGD